jgi:hypothetical protein
VDISQAVPSSNDGPTRVAVHGPEGTGKTTLAAYFPRPLFIGAEQGIPRDLGFSVPMISPRTWLDVFDIVGSLTNDQHDHQTAVLDTVDWVEPLIHKFVCERDTGRSTEMNPKGRPLISIEDYGFGKGFLAAEEEFRKLIGVLDILQYKRGMHVVMLAHSKVVTFKNPSGPDFDRWELKCHHRIGSVVKEWVENLLFLHYRIDASKISEDKERHKMSPDKVRAKGTSGERVLGAQHSAMYDAKNRVRMPAELELNDPNAVISMLLGEHLGSSVAPAAARVEKETPRSKSAQDTSRRELPPVDRREDAPAASTRDSRDERPPARDDRPASRGDDRQPPARDDRQRPADDQRPASQDDGKAAARTWSEPQRQEQRQEPAPAKSAPPSSNLTIPDAKRELDAAMSDARVLGDVYLRKASDSWIAEANKEKDDKLFVDKLAAITRRIRGDIAKDAARQQPRANG